MTELTELEYILSRPEYLGEPTKRRGNGESEWPCPQCGHERFHTMPDKRGFKHRARCWRCEFRGDALDMLAQFHPDETPPERWARYERLRVEYHKQRCRAVHSSGAGGGECVGEQRTDPALDAMAAIARLWDLDAALGSIVRELSDIEIGLAFGQQLLELIVTKCEAHDVTPAELLRFWRAVESMRGPEAAGEPSSEFVPTAACRDHVDCEQVGRCLFPEHCQAAVAGRNGDSCHARCDAN